MENPIKRDAEVAARVKKVMRITGAKKSTVYAVINGTRENEQIMSTYMELLENDLHFESKLLDAVKNAVPF